MNALAIIKSGIQARAYAGEIEGGADVLEYIGGIIVAALLIAALLIFGNLMSNSVNSVGNKINGWFTNVTNTVNPTMPS